MNKLRRIFQAYKKYLFIFLGVVVSILFSVMVIFHFPKFLYFYNSLILDNNRQDLVVSCNKFIRTKEQALKIKEQLENDFEEYGLMKSHVQWVEIDYSKRCKGYYIVVAYNGHRDRVIIEKFLKEKGVWNKYVFALLNV